jgi:hypothetical protein
MNFFMEWVLAVHRAVWFPLNWTLGLERPGVALPPEVAPHLDYGAGQPPLRLLKSGKRPARPCASGF